MKYVNKAKPKICFVLIGVNDIFAWISVETIFTNYKLIIKKLKEKNIIQSVLYSGITIPSAENRNVVIVS